MCGQEVTGQILKLFRSIRSEGKFHLTVKNREEVRMVSAQIPDQLPAAALGCDLEIK